MIPYSPPLNDMQFALEEVAALAEIGALPGCEAAAPDTVMAVLDEAAKLARDVLAPLNDIGDKTPARLENGVVRTPPGFKEAYRTYVDGGWTACLSNRSSAARRCRPWSRSPSPRCGTPRIWAGDFAHY
ncbi:MAG: acyl-CoA dehydrogenase N-terminal domain-containing protein [Aliidongia sp.]